MKKRFLACILLLLFCLSACSPSSGETQYTDFCVTAEIKTRRVKKDEPFEVKATFGQYFTFDVHNEARLKIKAPKLEILFQDGTRAEKEYEREISDFNHYGHDGHTETIRFVYIGTEDEYYGCFSIEIRAFEADDDLTDGIVLSDYVNVYYIVRDDYITITTKRPKHFTDLSKDWMIAEIG